MGRERHREQLALKVGQQEHGEEQEVLSVVGDFEQRRDTIPKSEDDEQE